MDLPFPVYGLRGRPAGEIEAARQLWTPDGPWWSVALRYGEFGAGDLLVVVTVPKLAQRKHGDLPVGPTGQFDARHMAQLELSAMTLPSDALPIAAADEAQAAGSGMRIGDPTTVELLVDNLPVTFEASTRAGIWAADADLGRFALAVYGTMPPRDVVLAPVRADLDAFVATG